MTSFDINNFDSIEGKVAVVTGSNSGIGFEISKILSSLGARVILACRNKNRGLNAQKLIKGNAEYYQLDLASFKSIDNFSKYISSNFNKVDFLINNAGVLFPPFSRTKNEIELTFGVNCIGYYYLSLRLLHLMSYVEGSRIINMSSVSQFRVKKIDWESINSEKNYNSASAYYLSNLFRTMYAIEMDTKFREKKFQTVHLSCHPGVSFTNLYANLPKILNNSVLANIMNHSFFQTPYHAAMPAIMAALSPEIKGGDFVGLDTRLQFRGKPKVVQPNELAFENNERQKLWDLSVQLTGLDLV